MKWGTLHTVTNTNKIYLDNITMNKTTLMKWGILHTVTVTITNKLYIDNINSTAYHSDTTGKYKDIRKQ